MRMSDWSSDVCSSDLLILGARFALADLGLEREASGCGDLFVTGQARTDDHRIARRIAELNRGRLEAGGRSDEYDRLALEALDRRRRHADRTAAATARELDGNRHRLADPPFATATVERGERRHEPRLRIQPPRHEGDARGRLPARCLDQHLVAGAHPARLDRKSVV